MDTDIKEGLMQGRIDNRQGLQRRETEDFLVPEIKKR